MQIRGEVVSGMRRPGPVLVASPVLGHFSCQHTQQQSSQTPRLLQQPLVGVLIHCFLNCLTALEEMPYADDALGQEKCWAASS